MDSRINGLFLLFTSSLKKVTGGRDNFSAGTKSLAFHWTYQQLNVETHNWIQSTDCSEAPETPPDWAVKAVEGQTLIAAAGTIKSLNTFTLHTKWAISSKCHGHTLKATRLASPAPAKWKTPLFCSEVGWLLRKSFSKQPLFTEF